MCQLTRELTSSLNLRCYPFSPSSGGGYFCLLRHRKNIFSLFGLASFGLASLKKQNFDELTKEPFRIFKGCFKLY